MAIGNHMSQSRKNLSLEGLRGMAAFVVVLSHLRLTFCINLTNDFRENLGFLPHGVVLVLSAVFQSIFNGNFAVWLFWIMSAFVLSLQFFKRARETPGSRAHDYLEDAFLRRYPRLMIPVLVSVALAYAIHACGMMHNLELAHVLGKEYEGGWLGSFYSFPANALEAVKTSMWHAFFSGGYGGCYGGRYNSVIWTMRNELFGSVYLFALLGLLGHRTSRYFLYPVFAVINYELNLHWLNAFVMGIVLCDLFVNNGILVWGESVIPRPLQQLGRSRLLAVFLWLFIIVGIGLLGVVRNFEMWSLLIGTSAVALTLISKFTQRILASPIPVFLGKISFGLYLVHFPIICSFSCWLYLVMFPLLGYGASSLLVSIATCGLSVLLGYVFYYFVDRPSLGLSRWLSSTIMNLKVGR
jgi:peptidoglycan/LPS O-acetylase OafA/YrhL